MHETLALLAEHRTALTWVSVLSAVMFVGSLLFMPVLVAAAPADYFVRAPVQRSLLRTLLRNALGSMLMLAGLLMLVLPGQGLLMMLLALSLLDLPGKHKLVRRLAARPAVWRALAYVRERTHKPPFVRP